MRKSIVAFAVLSVVSFNALSSPNPSPSAYDRIQDVRVGAIEKDVNGTKLSVIVVDKKVDGLLKTSSNHEQRITQNEQDIDHLNNVLGGTVQHVNDLLSRPLPKDGADGKDGTNGTDGAKGDKGDKGDTGAAGLNGSNGADGSNGSDGKDGQNGKDGANGADGITTTITQVQTDTATQHQVVSNTQSIADQQAQLRSVNKQFSDLKEKVDDNKKDASAAVAGVAAMANIPQVTEYQTFSIGAGAGTHDGENALAVGFSARVSQNTVTKASVATDTQSGFTAGVGVSYGW